MKNGLVAAIAVAAASFINAEPGLAAPTPCTGVLTGAIAGDVVVPDGATCTLDNATVSGDVTVQTGGTLAVVATSTVTVIRGSVKGKDCASIRVGNGPLTLIGQVVVAGDVRISSCAAQSGCDAYGAGHAPASVLIGGDFRCTDNPSACSSTACTIAGNLECSGNYTCAASANTVGGGMTLNDNVGIQLLANEIVGNLKCDGNGSLVGGFNTVAGTTSGQCAALPF